MDVSQLIRQAGGVNTLAAKLGIDRSTPYGWLRSGYLPGGRVVQIAGVMDLPVELVARLVKPLPVRRAA